MTKTTKTTKLTETIATAGPTGAGWHRDLPGVRVPRLERGGGIPGSPPPLSGLAWERAAVLGAFVLADGSAAAEQSTTVRLGSDRQALYVRFDCADRDAWGTYGRRNDPIYREEAVEVFLAPGEAAPRRYWEIEVSPLGVVFAARIDHPTGLRADLLADTSWECRGLEWQVGETGAAQDWWAALAIPWTAFSAGPQPAAAASGRRWRANFYRIERPRRGQTEFSCWSPTLTEPPDFHRPARFGRLELQVAPQPEA
jgi:hypothetical protein